MPAMASSRFSMPARCCKASTISRPSSTTATASTPICRRAARCAGTARSNTRHAFECLLDRMARELGLDPFAVRRANLLQAPTRTLNDLMVNSYGLAECLDRVERASRWRERIGKLPRGKGLGMACSHYVSGAAKPIHWTGEPHAVVNVRLDFDGGVTALTGAADIGQGSSTMVAIAVAETLGVSLERVRVIAGDSAVTPKDNGAYSSRITFMVGNAAIDAASKLKAILIEAAARKLEARPEDIECAGEAFRVGARRSIEPSVRRSREGGARRSRPDHGDGHVHLSARGPGRQASGRRGRLDHGIQLCRAGRRGERRRSDRPGDGRQGLGRARLRPCNQSARGRRPDRGIGLDGHGSGAERGNPLRRRAARCMPACSNIACRPASNRRRSRSRSSRATIRYGPFGAKEASEGALAGFPPALVNAIANAIGIDLDELPVTPDRVDGGAGRAAAPGAAGDGAEGRVMTALMPELHLAHPRDIDEAIAARREHAGSRFIAGGTDLLVNMRRGIEQTGRADRSFRHRRAGRDHESADGGVRIGAGVTIAALARDTDDGRALSRGDASRRGDRRSRPSRDGNRRRQSVPRHPLHLLQSKRMVAARQRLLPQASAAMSVTSRRRASVAMPPSPAILRRRCSRSAPRWRLPAHAGPPTDAA